MLLGAEVQGKLLQEMCYVCFFTACEDGPDARKRDTERDIKRGEEVGGGGFLSSRIRTSNQCCCCNVTVKPVSELFPGSTKMLESSTCPWHRAQRRGRGLSGLCFLLASSSL